LVGGWAVLAVGLVVGTVVFLTRGDSTNTPSGSAQSHKPDITKLTTSLFADQSSFPVMGGDATWKGPTTKDGMLGSGQTEINPPECAPLNGTIPSTTQSAGLAEGVQAHIFAVALSLTTDRPDFKSLLPACQTVTIGNITKTYKPTTLPGLPDWATAYTATRAGQPGWELDAVGYYRGILITAGALRDTGSDNITTAPEGFGLDEPNDHDMTGVVQLFNAQVAKLEAA
jgi:hypothetical protein